MDKNRASDLLQAACEQLSDMPVKFGLVVNTVKNEKGEFTSDEALHFATAPDGNLHDIAVVLAIVAVRFGALATQILEDIHKQGGPPVAQMQAEISKLAERFAASGAEPERGAAFAQINLEK